ncbi:hypothetical protein D3C73_1578370 [compost metagenome]
MTEDEAEIAYEENDMYIIQAHRRSLLENISGKQGINKPQPIVEHAILQEDIRKWIESEKLL